MKIYETIGSYAPYLRRNNDDWVHINLGKERSGKSTLGGNMGLEYARIVAPIFNREPKEIFNVDNVGFEFEEFRDICLTAQIGDAVEYDETVDILSRTPTSHENLNFIRLLQTIGEKSLFIIINAQRLRALEWVARGRAKTITICVKKEYPVVRGGKYVGWTAYRYYKFYNEARKNKFVFDNEAKRWRIPPPNYVDAIQKMPVDFWREYLKKKLSSTYLTRTEAREEQYEKFKKYALEGKTSKGRPNISYLTELDREGLKLALINISRDFQVPYSTVKGWFKRVQEEEVLIEA